MRRGSEVMTSNRMNVVFAVMMNSSGNGTMLIWNGIPIVPVERRERVIAIGIGSTGNGRNPTINGRRQPSCGNTSRMNREVHVRFCEGLGVEFPGPTRHKRPSRDVCDESGLPPTLERLRQRSEPTLRAIALNRYAIAGACLRVR